MKKAAILAALFFAIAVTFSDIPNIAKQQKQDLLPNVPQLTKGEVIWQENQRFETKNQIQLDFDVNTVIDKLSWIAQNEAAK